MTSRTRKPAVTKAGRAAGSAPGTDPRFAAVLAAFASEPAVTYGGGKGFGSGALKAGGTIFGFVSPKGRFVAKLPADRVDELIAQRQGRRFDAGKGRPMKEWLERSESATASWIAVARESFRFIRGMAR